MTDDAAPVKPADQIRTTLQRLSEPGGVVEIRALGQPGRPPVAIGYYDNLAAAVDDAVILDADEDVTGVYVTLNEVKPACLARAANHYKQHTTATSDKDIERRRWLPLDFDPSRPAGTSSSDEELAAAKDRVNLVSESLRAKGWSEPIFALSGNGAHLLYAIDLPNDPKAKSLVEQCLRALDFQYGDENVAIDTSVSNAARIWRLYGTKACKGDDLPDRPHRRSAIISAPAERSVVSLALLQQLSNTAPSERKAQSPANRADACDLEDFITRNEIEVIRSSDWDGGHKWMLASCPFDSSHNNGSAALLQFPNGAIAFKCFHDSCSGRKWNDVREHFEPGSAHRTNTGASDASSSQRGANSSQADQIVKLFQGLGTELVHDSAQIGYAIVPLPDEEGRAVYSIRSAAFRGRLAKEYYSHCGSAPSANAITDAKSVLEGQAIHGGPLVEVSLRVAGDDQVIDIDLGDDQWRMAHVTAEGWEIQSHGQRLFRRAANMLDLPDPARGGHISELRKFIRVSDDDYPLLGAFLATAIRPRGPYPILVLEGEQGSAKTTTARIIRRLIDPNRSDVRAEPRGLRDLAIAANNGRIIALDNLSRLSSQMSDALCRLSTGGGFATRTLYTDEDETVFEGERPIIITSIVEIASRPDLLDRCLIVRLRPIPENERRTERELWEEFKRARPRLFGALLDVASAALRNLPKASSITMTKPRMADAFTWASAAAEALNTNVESLIQAYSRTANAANASTLESSPIARPLWLLVADFGGTWSVTASDLLKRLNAKVSDEVKRRPDWPRTTRAIAAEVRRIAPALRATGMDHFEQREPQSGRRLHVFTQSPLKKGRQTASPSSLPSLEQPLPCTSGDDETSLVTQSSHAVNASVTREDPNYATSDDGDAGDDDFHPLLEATADVKPDSEAGSGWDDEAGVLSW
jgi:hypothetical protein